MTIKFDTSIEVPEELQNGDVFINENFPFLDIQVRPGYYSNLNQLGMNWTLVDFSPDQLTIQLNFENPLVVSSLQDDSDSIEVTIMGYPWQIDRKLNNM